MGGTNSVHFTRVAVAAIRKRIEEQKLKHTIRRRGLMLEIAVKDKNTERDITRLAEEVIKTLDLPTPPFPKIKTRRIGERTLFGSPGISKTFLKELARSEVEVDTRRGEKGSKRQHEGKLADKLAGELIEEFRAEKEANKQKEIPVEEHEKILLTVVFNGADLRLI